MTTSQILDKILYLIQELTVFHAELSRELPNLRVVVDNTRDFSELKKIPKRYCNFLFQGLIHKIPYRKISYKAIL